MNLKPEVVEQLERVLSSVEQLLPEAVEAISWERTIAATPCRNFIPTTWAPRCQQRDSSR